MAEDNNIILSAQGIKKAYPLPGGDLFYALKGVSVDIPKGKLTILKGRSGSGKTTLMNIMCMRNWKKSMVISALEKEFPVVVVHRLRPQKRRQQKRRQQKRRQQRRHQQKRLHRRRVPAGMILTISVWNEWRNMNQHWKSA